MNPLYGQPPSYELPPPYEVIHNTAGRDHTTSATTVTPSYPTHPTPSLFPSIRQHFTQAARALANYIITPEPNFSSEPKSVDTSLTKIAGKVNGFDFSKDLGAVITSTSSEVSLILIQEQINGNIWGPKQSYTLKYKPASIRFLSDNRILLLNGKNPYQILNLRTTELQEVTVTEYLQLGIPQEKSSEPNWVAFLGRYGVSFLSGFLEKNSTQESGLFYIKNNPEPLIINNPEPEPTYPNNIRPLALKIGEGVLAFINAPRTQGPIFINTTNDTGFYERLNDPVICQTSLSSTLVIGTKNQLHFNDVENGEVMSNLHKDLPGKPLQLLHLQKNIFACILDLPNSGNENVLKIYKWQPNQAEDLKCLFSIPTDKSRLKLTPDQYLAAFNPEQEDVGIDLWSFM